MAVLYGIDGSYFELKPGIMKKFWFSDSIDEDVEERYIFSINAKTGDYYWNPMEFSVEIPDTIDVEIEYIPMILTMFRLNKFFKNKMKNMISFVSTDSLTLTESVINHELLIYILNESIDFSAIYLNKVGKYYEHHFIFSRYDYQSIFDISVKATMTEIKRFYKALIYEFNKFRTNVLPEIINQENFLKQISERIKVIGYNELKNIEDNSFQLYNIKNIQDYIGLNEPYESLRAFSNFIAEMKKDKVKVEDEEDDDVDIEIFIDNEDDENENLWEIIEEIEEEIKSLLEAEETKSQLRNADYSKLNRDEKIDEIYSEIKRSYSIFNNKIEVNNPIEKEEKLLKSLILIYGIEAIVELKDRLKDDFKHISVEEILDNYLKNSEEGKIMEYKKWYKDVLKNLGRNLKQIK
ncbi:hypothetical protein XO10_06640 [Marinitoga sp. 1135]|uniref:Uncharacterized protein n=1 Tax=Marinitoga piezophila (strain DSM 14283 / JCM 11233 / KA3) TaxID=443254 RepID=H2J3D4_MARPK|nr:MULTISPECIES: hypothetical protein [Marinitoga]AEX85750.1 hypothetical protein Marpi_1347 [Marinitoga piezophila KA3]APT76195.1 hypothetical protein LN42_07195 [Marinitoga sp. 1137]NUU95954.1 hypothetical protein [Marinitoga sp. 1135]NUU97865.1 hypothetical protein [Marinitoga sp. 1138]